MSESDSRRLDLLEARTYWETRHFEHHVLLVEDVEGALDIRGIHLAADQIVGSLRSVWRALNGSCNLDESAAREDDKEGQL